jgi:hypothetical protein
VDHFCKQDPVVLYISVPSCPITFYSTPVLTSAGGDGAGSRYCTSPSPPGADMYGERQRRSFPHPFSRDNFVLAMVIRPHILPLVSLHRVPDPVSHPHGCSIGFSGTFSSDCMFCSIVLISDICSRVDGNMFD